MFAAIQTDDEALNSLAELGAGQFDDPGDPRAMKQWASRMGSLAGESGTGLGDEFDEYIEDVALEVGKNVTAGS